jgi:hypothetical protein
MTKSRTLGNLVKDGAAQFPDSLGTAGQALQVNSGATGLVFGDIAAGTTTVADIAALDQLSPSEGEMAFVLSNNNVYIRKTAGWYKIATVTNDQLQSVTVSLTGGGSLIGSDWNLATDGTATTAAGSATDPEGLSVTWSASAISPATMSGSNVQVSGTNIATVTQGTGSNTHQFTITPNTNDDAADFSLRFSVTDGVNASLTTDKSFTLVFGALASGVLFSTTGSHSWTVPTGVTSVSVVCIGGGGGGGGILAWSGSNPRGPGGGAGGGLGYKNNISVTPGSSVTVVVGEGGNGGHGSGQSKEYGIAGGDSYFISDTTVKGDGGLGGQGSNTDFYNYHNPSNRAGGTYVGDGGGNGGAGGKGGAIWDPDAAGGGGAGGYSAAGGIGDNAGSGGNYGSGSGGSASGGNAHGSSQAYGGGGVNPYGSGTAGSSQAQGGSGGGNGNNTPPTSNSAQDVTGGGAYGGGGGGRTGSSGNYTAHKGANGVVRVIWGDGRSFPSTNVAASNSVVAETTV